VRAGRDAAKEVRDQDARNGGTDVGAEAAEATATAPPLATSARTTKRALTRKKARETRMRCSV
jgi:hypothetical protein